MNSYDLSRKWFNWCFENPEKIVPNHTALYFFCIEQCNRLGWKDKFGLPTAMAKEAIGIRSYNTYIKTLNDLVDFGFIKLVEKSKNQYSSNIIALLKNNKAHTKALDNALIKHSTKHTPKQHESTSESTDSIDKQVTINNKQINNKPLTITAEPKNEYWFRIRDTVYLEKISEYLVQNFGTYLQHYESKNEDYSEIMTELLPEMLLEYNCCDFSNENHIRNTFKSLFKIKKEKRGGKNESKLSPVLSSHNEAMSDYDKKYGTHD